MIGLSTTAYAGEASSVTVSPTGAGTVDKTIEHGNSTLTAIAEDGYVFDHWSIVYTAGGSAIITDTPYTDTTFGMFTATAYFTGNDASDDVWYVGDTFDMSGKYVVPDDKDNYTGFVSGSNVVPEPETYSNRWFFRNVINASTGFLLTPPTGNTDTPAGFKLVSGEGTSTSPYTFELVYDAPSTTDDAIDLTYTSETARVVWIDKTGSEGWWSIYAEASDYVVGLCSDSSFTQAAGTYQWSDMKQSAACSVCAVGLQDVFFTDGTCTVTVDGGLVHVDGIYLGTDGNSYHVDITYGSNSSDNDYDLSDATATVNVQEQTVSVNYQRRTRSHRRL